LCCSKKAHHLLGDDLVADVGLEILIGDALILGRLFQVFQGLQVVLLANLVQPRHQFGVAVDAQFLAFGEPELLVDEVAQQILVASGDLLHRRAVLVRLGIQLLHGAVVVRARDDLIVDAGDDLFDRGAAIRTLGRGGMRLRRSGRCEQQCGEHESRGSAKDSQSHRGQDAPGGRRIASCCIDVIVNGWAASKRFRKRIRQK